MEVVVWLQPMIAADTQMCHKIINEDDNCLSNLAFSPYFTLNDTFELSNILSWRESPLKFNRSSIEHFFVEELERKIVYLREYQDFLKTMDQTLINELSHDPYVAGYLKKQFIMSDNQLIYHIAKRQIKSKNTDSMEDLLANKIKITFEDSDALPLFDNGERFTTDLIQGEQKKILLKLDESINAIKIFLPNCFDFVTSYLWVLALRVHPTGPLKLGSRSYQCLPGLALFCNPHAYKVTSFEFEEALIHESIHSFLFFCENDDARLLKEQRFNSQQVVSPWTGSQLDFHTGVHALVVWKSLLKYWSKTSDKGSPERREFAGQRVDFIRRGMSSEKFKNYEDEVLRKVHVDISNLIQQFAHF